MTVDQRGTRASGRTDPPTVPHSAPAAGIASSHGASPAAETNPLKRLLKTLGPGLITSASDDDPSGIGTYAVAGASLGSSTFWTRAGFVSDDGGSPVTYAKVGMVSGIELAGVLYQRYPHPLVYLAVFALVAANSINAGADIGAIAAAINLLVPIPLTLLIVPIGVAILAWEIWGHTRPARGGSSGSRSDCLPASARHCSRIRIGLMSCVGRWSPSCHSRDITGSCRSGPG